MSKVWRVHVWQLVEHPLWKPHTRGLNFRSIKEFRITCWSYFAILFYLMQLGSTLFLLEMDQSFRFEHNFWSHVRLQLSSILKLFLMWILTGRGRRPLKAENHWTPIIWEKYSRKIISMSSYNELHCVVSVPKFYVKLRKI